MTYYPKSQISTNLYTPGEQLRIKSTKKEYTGYYWKTSKGEFFTGKTPNDINPQPLEIIPTTPVLSYNTVVITKDNKTYNELKEVDITKVLLLPPYSKSSPTVQDYVNGSFIRFFAKKINENLYIEISQKIFNKLSKKDESYDYKSYIIFPLTWILTGNSSQVSQINYNSVLLTEQRLKINSLGKYLNNNYLEFYK